MRRKAKRVSRMSFARGIVAYSYLYMLVGALLIALSFNLFLLPNRIASGGVSGISVILDSIWLIPPAYTQWALNIPLFDIIHTGLQTSKAAFIISKHSEQVSTAILHDLDRGLTKLQGVGGYTGEDRPVLLAVVSQNEVIRLKALVRDVDPNAFVMIGNASEVLGKGFHKEGHP